MQIQIISADSQNVTRLAVAEHKAGQAAVKHVVQPGQKITLLVDGVTLKGGQVVGSKKLKLVKSDKNLVVETEDGTEKIVELSDFFEQKDTVLTGNEWVFDEGSLLQTLDEGVVALPVPAAPALGSAMVGAAAGGFSAAGVGAAAAGIGLIAGGGGGDTTPIATTNPFDKIEAYNNGNGTTPAALTPADYEAAGITGVTPDNVAVVNAQVLKQVEGGANTVGEVQALVNGLKTAAANLGVFAEANTQGIATPTGTVPVLANYTAAGVTGVTDGANGNISAINDALASAAVTGAKADTPAELQAIVDAYKAILAEANDADNTAGDGTTDVTPTVDPTPAQYAAIGADIGAAATDADNLALLNDIIGGQQTTGVDRVEEINELARIANAIQTVAAGGTVSPALTVEDLAKIGLDTTGVTPDSLTAVMAAIAAKDNGGGETDSLSELQVLLGAAVSKYTAAIDKIADYAETGASAPSLQDYIDAGVSGVTDTNLVAINSAINAQNGADNQIGTVDDRNDADSAAKVQAIVNAYTAILGEANDTANTAGDGTTDATPTVDPTPAQYAAIGADIGAAATDAENLALLNDIVGGKQTGDVNTVAEINDLARIANAIQSVAAGGTSSPALTLADLTQIGLDTTALTTDSLPAVLAAIAAKDDSGSATDSLSELQGILNTAVNNYNTAIDKIADYAETGAVEPVLQDFVDAGITGVTGTTSGNLAAIVDAINNQKGSDTTLGNANDRAGADTAVKVQAIVDAYTAILAEANDAANTPGDGTADTTSADPTPAQYATVGADIGAAASDAENLSLLNDIVAAQQTTGVDSVSELNNLARIVNAIQAVAAGGTPNPALTVADLSKIGINTSNLTADTLPALMAAIVGKADGGGETDTLAKLQAIVDATATNYAAAIDKIADYAETGVTAPTVQDYLDAGVSEVTSGFAGANLNAINDAINNQKGSDNTLGNANDRAGADTATAAPH